MLSNKKVFLKRRRGEKMIITKILNNNVIIVKDERDNELIVMGKSLGFQNRVGNTIDESKIEKTYVLKDSDLNQNLVKLIEEIPQEHFEVSSELIDYAKQHLNGNLNDRIYVSLTDHLTFAIKRHHENITYGNRLYWEVKKFYPEEFQVALYGLELIKDRLGVELPEAEAANIAFHFINAGQSEKEMQQTMLVTNIMKDVLNIVRYHFNVILDEETLNYTRFVTHLQFFAQRLLTNKLNHSDDDFIYQQVKKKYVKEFECAQRIADYIVTGYNRTMTSEELVYLTIHIARVISRD